jgi:hypothetical protein
MGPDPTRLGGRISRREENQIDGSVFTIVSHDQDHAEEQGDMT